MIQGKGNCRCLTTLWSFVIRSYEGLSTIVLMSFDNLCGILDVVVVYFCGILDVAVTTALYIVRYLHRAKARMIR